MTVKELKEKLSQYPDDLLVLYPSELCGYHHVRNVSRGINEYDGLVFIDNYREDEDDA